MKMFFYINNINRRAIQKTFILPLSSPFSLFRFIFFPEGGKYIFRFLIECVSGGRTDRDFFYLEKNKVNEILGKRKKDPGNKPDMQLENENGGTHEIKKKV